MIQLTNMIPFNNFKSIKRCYSTAKSKKWKSVVGLEVHAQIFTESKLFSGSSTKFTSPVNSNVSLFDCSTPGTLPVLNKSCVEAGVLTALALNCNINPVSTFDRKHYFYADMPSGYQITQQRSPLALNGKLAFQVYTPGYHKTPYKTEVKIKQVQLEQDSGKSLHDDDRSLVDLNRAGIPLMELVFEPDLKDGEEAAALIKELTSILQRINTCSCKMEEGALRVDANVSIHQEGEPYGTRTEIKNIGSVRGVAGAVKYEIERQIKVKESGGTITNETRAWDAASKITVAMRDKEELQDYRYMPEPNLPPLHVAVGPFTRGCVNVEELKNKIPELPEETRVRLKNEMGLSSEQAIVLVNDTALLNIFETALEKRKISPKLLANFLINEFNTMLNKLDKEAKDIDTSPKFYGDIVELLENNKINRNTAKYLLGKIIENTKETPLEILQKEDLLQISNEEELKEICAKVIEENEKLVKQYKAGKTKVFKAIMGCVSAKTKGKADMGKCEKLLKDMLN
ncbi:unnamed protein product [Brassicogethes aeneus]|uniref:Glutamyl-tRNA(Gln) amidotransferase subunit B, mitochondrial n=1 Tax=Brassicogethes aeneus TaxID=1431903 RepID=A0A9P0ATS3_BRAAE|nr:unnamed protein product [Brassicogethes aeneus]